MAVLQGLKTRGALVQDYPANYSQDLNELQINQTVRVGSVVEGADRGSSLTQGARITRPQRALAGIRTSGFAQLWYDRIHLRPRRIEFGNITNTQERTVEVWNAHDAARTLTNIEDEGIGGVGLTGTRAKTFGALESVIYTLTVSLDGAPKFEGFYEWVFGAERPRLDVSGQRVLSFPFFPDWDAGVEEKLAFLTDVQRSRKGKEQRRRLRDHARRKLSYEILLSDVRARRRFEALMFGWQHRTFSVPVVTDVCALSGDITAGTRTFPVDAKFRDFEANSLMMFVGSHTDTETAEIESVTDTSVTLKRGTNRAWKRDTVIVPARLGVLPASFSIRAITSKVERARMDFEIKTSEVSTRRAVAGVRAMYKGADVFLKTDNVTDGDQMIDVGRKFDRIDFETGAFRNVAAETGTSDTTDWRLLLRGRAAISDFLAWFNERAGQLKGVWVPTWDFDFEIIDSVNAQANAMIVENMNYASMYTKDAAGTPNDARRDIIFMRGDGSVFCRRITDAQQSEDGETEVITLDQTFGESFDPEDFDRISFLNYRRLDQDGITLSWITDEVLQVAFRFKDLLTTAA